jgi:hypothetical protein
MKKHTVTDPRSTGIWIYEVKADGTWTAAGPKGAGWLDSLSDSEEPSALDGILELHRLKGRIIETVDVES